ncbi:FeoB-associated Cys-rich membrane protein [Winslowiella iniecta]|nr:FeoB-associated Cys-rich membrane protein [Winslowiella iniecta]
MLMLIVVAILIALMGFAIIRHWKMRKNKLVVNPHRQPRRH